MGRCSCRTCTSDDLNQVCGGGDTWQRRRCITSDRITKEISFFYFFFFYFTNSSTRRSQHHYCTTKLKRSFPLGRLLNTAASEITSRCQLQEKLDALLSLLDKTLLPATYFNSFHAIQQFSCKISPELESFLLYL